MLSKPFYFGEKHTPGCIDEMRLLWLRISAGQARFPMQRLGLEDIFTCYVYYLELLYFY
jgi:hypothetical protein